MITGTVTPIGQELDELKESTKAVIRPLWRWIARKWRVIVCSSKFLSNTLAISVIEELKNASNGFFGSSAEDANVVP